MAEDWFEKRARKNRVFILGAGFSASASAGIPLTSSLLELAMKKFSIECNGIFSRVDSYAQESINSFSSDVDYSNINFSDLCTFLEYIELREYGGGERWSDAGSREKLALRFYLAKTIAEKTPNGDQLPELYINFAKQLHEGDIILSFNWDGLLESAIREVGKEYTYNFSEEKHIKLCKLHGSVNWRLGEPNRGGESINTLGWQSLNFTDGMMDTEIFHTPALLYYGNWNSYSPLGEVDPFLVLPGYGKAFDVRSNATLWYKPEWAFAMTRDVYIIGLSLAPDDFFIRSYFLSNLPYLNSTNTSKRNIYIINPDSSANESFDFVLSNKNAELWQEPFSSKHVDFMKNKLKKA